MRNPTVRFLADMGISPAVADSLRQRGHDALHVRDLNMQRSEDEEILALADAQYRIVLTHDLDFGRLLALSDATGPSIVTFRLSNMQAGSVLAALLDVIDQLGPRMERGAAVTVDDRATRWRRLPLRND